MTDTTTDYSGVLRQGPHEYETRLGVLRMNQPDLPADIIEGIVAGMEALGITPRNTMAVTLSHDGRPRFIEYLADPVVIHGGKAVSCREAVPLPGHGQSRRRLLNRHSGS